MKVSMTSRWITLGLTSWFVAFPALGSASLSALVPFCKMVLEEVEWGRRDHESHPEQRKGISSTTPARQKTQEPVQDVSNPVVQPIESAVDGSFAQVVQLESIGSGCDNNLQYEMSRDGSLLTIWDLDVVAESGYGIPASLSRSNCQISVSLAVEQGYRFAVNQIRGIGFADITKGTTGQYKSSVYFQGSENESFGVTEIVGGVREAYSASQKLLPLQWSNCEQERALQVNNQVRLSGKGLDKNQDNIMTLEGKLEIHLIWDSCI